MKTILSITLLFFTINSLALNPSRTYKQSPEKYNMVYKSLDIKTNDGKAKIKAWYFAAKKKTTNLILISHNGEGNMGDYLRRVDQFTSIGYNVVTYDYRGFGESSEFDIDNNMYIYPHFLNDMETMIDYCRKNFSQSFSLYGWGIGGGLSLGVGYGRTEIRKIIADTPFLSMEDLESRFSSWDKPMEVPFAGFDKRFEPIHTLENEAGKNLSGVLLVVGSKDNLMNVEDMKKLASKSPKLIGKNIYVVENPDRKDNFRVGGKDYLKRISAFMN